MTQAYPGRAASSAVLDYRLHPDVIWVQRPDGSSRLIHLDRNISGLDGASTRLLRIILDRGVDDAVRAYAQQCNQAPDEARADVNHFLAQLKQEGVVQPLEPRHPVASGLREGLARLTIATAIAAACACCSSTRARARAMLFIAYGAVVCFRWGTTARVWRQIYARSSVDVPREGAHVLDEIDVHVRDIASRSILSLECKERALACLALARRSGYPVDLVIGLSYTPLRAHVWVTYGERILSDDGTHCRGYEPVWPYAAAAR